MSQEPDSDSDPESESESPLAGGGRRKVVAVVIGVLLAAGVWLLIGELSNVSELARALHRIGVGWLTLAVLSSFAGYGGYAVLFQVLTTTDRGPDVPLRLVGRLTIAIFGASVIATSAGRLGTEYWAMRRLHEKRPSAWSRVLGINTALWAVLAWLAWAGAAVVLVVAPARSVPGWLEISWLAVPPALTAAGTFLTSARHRHLADDRGGRLRRTVAAALRGIVLIRHVLRDPRRGGPMVVGAVVLWGGELVTVWAALRAFDYHLGYGALVLGYATGYISTVLPLPAGGAGGVDAATAYALTLVGVPLTLALLATVIQRMCTYWIPLVVAIVAARWIKRLGSDLASVPRMAHP